MKKNLLLIITLLLSKISFSQDEINVLFLGNSYTYVNDLPKIIEDIAANGNKTINYESVTPGGCTLFQHAESLTSLSKIRKGNWDYVILQEQSQLPTIDYYRHNAMKPAYKTLYDSIMYYNPDAKVVGYMTWGRRLGGMQCVNFGEGLYCSADFIDFNHMQDTLTVAYCENAYSTDSYVAPVGEAWKLALATDPTLVLHSNDDSHPSYNGSYLAACVFYAVLWNKTPIGIYHDNKMIDAVTAELLQNVANNIVFNNLDKWNIKYSESINTESHSENFKIENDPYSDSIIIKNINNIHSNVKIYNVNGCIILDKEISCDKSLNLKNCKGLFIIQICEGNSIIHTEKIIKY